MRAGKLRPHDAVHACARTGETRRHSPASSAATQASTTRMTRDTSTRGGGSAAPAAHHSATMPPQASMARRTTVRARGCSGDCSSEGASSGTAGTAASDWSSLQISAPAATSAAGSLLMQHDASARLAAAEQQEGFLGALTAFATACGSRFARCSRATSTAGSTRCAFAQTRISAGVLQQQLVKHCSAVAQPQALSIQGNGRERSLAARRLAMADSGAAGAMPARGNGRPEATSV